MTDRGRHRGREGADAALVAALALGASVEQAATRAGVSARTVHRRLKDADFTRHISDARAELLAQAMARLSASVSSAVDTLTALLGAESDSVRLGAARAILDSALRWRTESDVAVRLDRMEAWLDAMDEAPADGRANGWRFKPSWGA